MTDNEVELRRAKADDQMRAAILEHADAYMLSRDDEMLNQFALIVHWATVEADGKSRYSTHYHSDDVPGHVAYGLFSYGAQLCQDEQEWD